MTEVLRIRARVAAAPGAVHAALTSGAALREWLAESAEVDLAARRFEFWGGTPRKASAAGSGSSRSSRTRRWCSGGRWTAGPPR